MNRDYHPRAAKGSVNLLELKMRNLIAQNLVVHCNQNQSFQLRLRDQQPIEGISM